MKKKILIIALALSLVAVSALGVTLAYFTANKTATNTFTIGNVGINLTETRWDASGVVDGRETYPGEALEKNPVVTSTGANPCIVRVWVDMKGLPITIEGLDLTNWYQDGKYYYYLKPLAGSAESVAGLTTATTELFKQIRLSKDVTNNDAATLYSIDVNAEAMQAQGVFSKFADMVDGISLTATPTYGSDTEINTVISAFTTAFGH